MSYQPGELSGVEAARAALRHEAERKAGLAAAAPEPTLRLPLRRRRGGRSRRFTNAELEALATALGFALAAEYVCEDEDEQEAWHRAATSAHEKISERLEW